jgi:hypothetical protein
MARVLSDKIPPDMRLEKAIERVQSHLPRATGKQKTHLKMWVITAAHAAFQLHPELREEGSLPRYFVAKEGRKRGLRGAALGAFVEQKYNDGTWWHLVPEDVLMGKPKKNPWTIR